MARIPRKYIAKPGHSVHKIWRGHNKEFNLAHAVWKLAYLKFMNIELNKLGDLAPPLHALTLMDNHVHELFKIVSQVVFSNFMRRHHGRYGRYFNDANKRTGKVAEDRPKTSVLENDYVEREVTLYIHANPYRAKMNRRRAINYRWSTHRLYAYGIREDWMENITLPRWYLQLGKTMKDRQRSYRKIFAKYLQHKGLEKRQDLSFRFVGSTNWVNASNEELREIMRTAYPAHPP